jgi:hypothetical protein
MADQVSPKEADSLHRILQTQAYNKLGLICRDDGSLTNSREESYQILMAEHFPGFTPLIVSDPEGEIPDAMGATSQFPNPVLVDPVPWLSLVTLDLAFKQFGKHKCPGPDGYRPIVISNLPLKARAILIKLYTAIIALQYTPQRCRNVEVIFLPKPGKDDYTNRRAFLPISLMHIFIQSTREDGQMACGR